MTPVWTWRMQHRRERQAALRRWGRHERGCSEWGGDLRLGRGDGGAEDRHQRNCPRSPRHPSCAIISASSTERLAGPQAFLIETYPPEQQTAAHFHSTDQFQIFFPAEGAYYQRTEIRSPLLHYSDAYTTYGPLEQGGADGPLHVAPSGQRGNGVHAEGS